MRLYESHSYKPFFLLMLVTGRKVGRSISNILVIYIIDHFENTFGISSTVFRHLFNVLKVLSTLCLCAKK